MSLKSIINYISNSQITNELIERLNKDKEINIIGSSRFAKALLLDSIASNENKNILLICSNTEIAYKWYGYFESINNNNVLFYPPNENLPYEIRNKSSEVEFSQLNIISRLLNKNNDSRNILITTERSLQPHLLNKKYFTYSNLNIKKGDKLELIDLTQKLIDLGYCKEEITTTEGQWSRRGNIIDIFAANNEVPIRIEFFDNYIEKIREYDPSTQKTLDTINNINITHCGSYQKIINELKNLSKDNSFILENNNRRLNIDRFLGLIENEPASIIDFIDNQSLVIFDELDECRKFTKNWFYDSEANFKNNFKLINEILNKNKINKKLEQNLFKNDEEIYKKFLNFIRLNLYEFESKNNYKNKFLLSDKIISSPVKNISKISNEVINSLKINDKVWFITAQPLRTKSLLFENKVNTFYLEN